MYCLGKAKPAYSLQEVMFVSLGNGASEHLARLLTGSIFRCRRLFPEQDSSVGRNAIAIFKKALGQ
jgi:hypothetical protein